MDRRLLTIAGTVTAVVTGAAAAGIAIATTQQRRHGEDPLADEELGDLSPVRTSTVAADDGTPLAVSEVDPEEGEPELTVIGVHGFALSQRCWHFQRRALGSLSLPRVRQVYYDHRGHGLSGAANQETSTIEQLARDLDAVIRAVAPDGPIVLWDIRWAAWW